MSDVQKSCGLCGRSILAALLCISTTECTAAKAPPLPALEPVAVEVDITRLPASEQAALVQILRAARQIDTVYMRQVWHGTRALIVERQSVRTSAARAELDALNFFKGPWGPSGGPFIGGVPWVRT